MNDSQVKLRDGEIVNEKYACKCVACQNHPNGPAFAETRYSMGIYAGRYCDIGWKNSGYRDVGPEEFDPSYAGESLEPEDY
jgi:hypothetical protein